MPRTHFTQKNNYIRLNYKQSLIARTIIKKFWTPKTNIKLSSENKNDIINIINKKFIKNKYDKIYTMYNLNGCISNTKYRYRALNKIKTINKYYIDDYYIDDYCVDEYKDFLVILQDCDLPVMKID